MRKWTIVLAVMALALAACSGGDGSSDGEGNGSDSTAAQSGGDVAHGTDLYTQSCAACHGPDGVGIEGLGRALANSEFVSGKSDADLVAFIASGRPEDDPDNTTGVAMPPKGGNPSLTNADLLDIVAYLRTLN